MTQTPLKTKTAEPAFAEILKKVSERNETAAVDICGRLLLGLLGLIGAVVVFIFADPADKVLGIVFLFVPTLPVIWRVTDDYLDAKISIERELSEVQQ